jgi:hypothetical protein
MTPAAAWLHRAAAEATVLSLSRGTDPAGAAGRFARDLRDATQRLVGATLVRPVAGTGPDGKPWAEWLRALTDRPAVPASSPMPEDGGWPAGKVVCRASAGGATPPAVELSVDEGPALLRLLLTAAAGALAVSLWFAAGRSDARSERLLFLGALTGAFLPAPAGWVAIGVLAAGLLGLAGRAVVARLPRRQRSTPLG